VLVVPHDGIDIVDTVMRNNQHDTTATTYPGDNIRDSLRLATVLYHRPVQYCCTVLACGTVLEVVLAVPAPDASLCMPAS